MNLNIPNAPHDEPVVFLCALLSNDPKFMRAANIDVGNFYKKYAATHIIKEELQMTPAGDTIVVLQATCLFRFFETQQWIGISGVRAQLVGTAYAQQMTGPQVQPGAASQVPPPPPAKKGLFRG